MMSRLPKAFLSSSFPLFPFLAHSWYEESRRLRAEPGMEFTVPAPIPGPPEAGVDSPILQGKGQGDNPPPFLPFLPGHVLLEKTLIPGCYDNKRQWLTAGVGE